MTPEQVTLVQQTFGQVASIADKAAEIFYDRLFEVAPAVRPLFQGDMAEQRRKLMAMLAAVVRGLSDLPSVLPAASALAKRRLRRTAGTLSRGWRGAAVDAGARTWAAVDAGGGRRLDRGLFDPVGLHDRTGLRLRPGGRIARTPAFVGG
jgi:hypothetical protein